MRAPGHQHSKGNNQLCFLCFPQAAFPLWNIVLALSLQWHVSTSLPSIPWQFQGQERPWWPVLCKLHKCPSYFSACFFLWSLIPIRWKGFYTALCYIHNRKMLGNIKTFFFFPRRVKIKPEPLNFSPSQGVLVSSSSFYFHDTFWFFLTADSFFCSGNICFFIYRYLHKFLGCYLCHYVNAPFILKYCTEFVLIFCQRLRWQRPIKHMEHYLYLLTKLQYPGQHHHFYKVLSHKVHFESECHISF